MTIFSHFIRIQEMEKHIYSYIVLLQYYHTICNYYFKVLYE